MNNYEKIKAMTIEEMCNFLDESPCFHCVDFGLQEKDRQNCLRNCKRSIKQWLEQEAE